MQSAIVALIQVRMGSSRLPGKAMMELCGRPILGHAIDRIRAVRGVDDIIIVTSETRENDCIQEFCKQEGIICVRGPEEDVCSRFYGAIQKYPAQHYLRFCADAPMQDSGVIDEVIKFHLNAGADYTTNGVKETRTFPLGIDVRIAKRQLFIDSFRERDESLQNAENPLAYVHIHPQNYKISLYEASAPLRRPELRFIVDYSEDMAILRRVFNALYVNNPLFGCAEAIAYVDSHPQLKELMGVVTQYVQERALNLEKERRSIRREYEKTK